MINATPFQWSLFSLISFAFGCILTAIVAYFVIKNIQERKKKRTTPFVQSILSRYTDLMYDEKYSKVSDREFIKLLRDTALVMLWLVIEASIRLTRKMEKEEKKL